MCHSFTLLPKGQFLEMPDHQAGLFQLGIMVGDDNRMSFFGHLNRSPNRDGRMIGDRLVAYVAEHARLVEDVRLAQDKVLRVTRGKHRAARQVNLHGLRHPRLPRKRAFGRRGVRQDVGPEILWGSWGARRMFGDGPTVTRLFGADELRERRHDSGLTVPHPRLPRRYGHDVG